jgi:putative flippase GtrA
MIQPLIRFYAVGAGGVVVQLSALALLESGFGLNYLAATALAVEAALLHNFFWHERWTWGQRARLQPRGRAGRLIRFHLTNGIVSILGNLLFMQLLTGRLQMPYLASNAVAIGLCSALNVLAADRLVFAEE